jgi:hypothetical protein
MPNERCKKPADAGFFMGNDYYQEAKKSGGFSAAIKIEEG